MATKQTYAYEPDYAIAPGETLEEMMKALGMTQQELAERTGLTVQTLNRIFKGEQPITYETANKLEYVTGYPASFWNNLEAQYREQLKKLEAKQPDEALLNWAKSFNYARMAAAGWLPATRSLEEKTGHLLSFFQVSGVAEWEAVHMSTVNKGAYRVAAALQEHRVDNLAWIQRGTTLARALHPHPFDEKAFTAAWRDVRSWVQRPPQDVTSQLEARFSEAGVALIFLNTLPGMGVHGYARWIKRGGYYVVIHGLRHKSDDFFWFDLFHELAHIALHGKSHEFIEYEGRDDPREQEADAWAARHLIPDRDWQSFVDRHARPTAQQIRAFAAEVDVAPGIVVGRLQREHRIPHESGLNKLKRFLKDDIDAIQTSPARQRINFDLLGTARPSIRRNKATVPDLAAIRESLTSSDYADLRD
jgi:HTH-type transcriptional regulator / antitoxin HigA